MDWEEVQPPTKTRALPWGSALLGVAAASGAGAMLAPYVGLATALGAGAGGLAWEAGWWARRRARRGSVYEYALARARALGRPLVVVGAPDGGVTAGYGCGDITVDLAGSSCPHTLRADVTRRLPFADDSVVIFASCVLEYVHDVDAAIHELHRVAGAEVYCVGVEPWTLTSIAYPGARQALPPRYR